MYYFAGKYHEVRRWVSSNKDNFVVLNLKAGRAPGFFFVNSSITTGYCAQQSGIYSPMNSPLAVRRLKRPNEKTRCNTTIHKHSKP